MLMKSEASINLMGHLAFKHISPLPLIFQMNVDNDLPHDPVLKMYNNAVGRAGGIM